MSNPEIAMVLRQFQKLRVSVLPQSYHSKNIGRIDAALHYGHIAKTDILIE